jgi:hypothetical protein
MLSPATAAFHAQCLPMIFCPLLLVANATGIAKHWPRCVDYRLTSVADRLAQV